MTPHMQTSPMWCRHALRQVAPKVQGTRRGPSTLRTSHGQIQSSQSFMRRCSCMRDCLARDVVALSVCEVLHASSLCPGSTGSSMKAFSKRVGALQWATDSDMILVGLGRARRAKDQVVAQLTAKFPVLGSFSWRSPMRIRQEAAQFQKHAEFVVLGVGPLSAAGRIPRFRRVYPTVSVKRAALMKPTLPVVPDGEFVFRSRSPEPCFMAVTILSCGKTDKQAKPCRCPQPDRDVVGLTCTVSEWARGLRRPLTIQPEGGSESPPPTSCAEQSIRHPPRSSQTMRGSHLPKGCRNGMHCDVWLHVLNSLAPQTVILSADLHLQGGLALACVRYSNRHTCCLAVFHPQSGKMTSHAADHVL